VGAYHPVTLAVSFSTGELSILNALNVPAGTVTSTNPVHFQLVTIGRSMRSAASIVAMVWACFGYAPLTGGGEHLVRVRRMLHLQATMLDEERRVSQAAR
jgi:hypothetical protein